jgi:hypothetical protein
MSTKPNTYGDPSITSSWLRGNIPTIVDSTSDSEANRHNVFLVGRSLLKASEVTNGSPSEPAAPLDTTDGKILHTDQYVYFHLSYDALASSTTPPSTTPVASTKKRLSFRSSFITAVGDAVNYAPANFILGTKGAAVEHGKMQPFTLSPVLDNATNLKSLNYGTNSNPLLNAYDATASGSGSAMYLVPQGTQSIEQFGAAPIVGNSAQSLDFSTKQPSAATNKPNLPPHLAYTGVWYKAYSTEAEAMDPSAKSNLWHVTNPLKNAPPASKLSNALLTGGPADTVQLGGFTEGGGSLPNYIDDGANNPPKAHFEQSPTAIDLYESKSVLTSQDYVDMFADVNDIGNVLENWGLSEMEFMFVPVQASIVYSGNNSPSLGCYTSKLLSGLIEFQEFATSPLGDTLNYADPYIGSIFPTGCITPNASGWLHSSDANATIFNDCLLMDTHECTTTGDVSGYWYPYCTGAQSCGTNNCFGNCPNDSTGNHVTCARDYGYTETSNNGSTFWSCSPTVPNDPSGGASGTSSTATYIVLGIIIFFVVAIIAFLVFWFWSRSRKTTPKVQPTVDYGNSTTYKSGTDYRQTSRMDDMDADFARMASPNTVTSSGYGANNRTYI